MYTRYLLYTWYVGIIPLDSELFQSHALNRKLSYRGQEPESQAHPAARLPLPPPSRCAIVIVVLIMVVVVVVVVVEVVGLVVVVVVV